MENSAVNYVDLGHRIAQLRKQKKLTQKQLAEKTGLTGPYIGLVERAVSKPSLETIVSIANVLEVSLNYLLSASLNNVGDQLKPESSPSQRAKLHNLLSEMQQQLDGWSGAE